MRILAFSDVSTWDPYGELVDKWKPAVITLGGDLVSDGGADFWRTALDEIPAYRRDMRKLSRQTGVLIDPTEGYEIIPSKTVDAYRDGRLELEDRYRETKAFLRARKRIHVDKFYAFLRCAGKRSSVLVIKGNHDDDFANDYDPRRIDAIPGCQEISGKAVLVNGVRFLGLGFDQAAYRRPLRKLVLEHQGKVDVVIAHAPQENVRIVAELEPSLMIRGHFGIGRYSIDGVPSVFTAGAHAVIDIGRTGPPRVQFSRQGPWGLPNERLLRKGYPWLRPYPR